VAKAPRPAPAPTVAGASLRRAGRWPLLVPDLPVCGAPSRRGGGNAGRVSCSRPDGRSRGCPVSRAGAIAPATAPRRDQDQPGAQSPRPAPAPPPAGASRPPGRALAFRGARTHRSTGHRPARAGETRLAFPVPARTGESAVTAAMAGAIAPATAPPCPLTSRGPKPPGQCPPRPRRALACRGPGPSGPQGSVARGRGKRGPRFGVRPERKSIFNGSR